MIITYFISFYISMPIDFKLLIKNVKTLNLIQVKDKLNISKENVLSIDKKCFYRSFTRYINSQNREKSNLFIINLINDLSTELSKFYLYNTNKSKYKKEELNINNFNEYDEYYKLYKKIQDSILLLRETYKDDKLFVKKLNHTYNRVDALNPYYRSDTLPLQSKYCSSYTSYQNYNDDNDDNY